MKRHSIRCLAGVCVYLSCQTPGSAAVIFSESVGAVTKETPIAVHETAGGFDNDALTFSGSGDVRGTEASSGYAGASGSANVFLSYSGTPDSDFRIDGISTEGHTVGSVGLSFGAFKDRTTSDMTTLVLEYSTNGSTWTSLAIPAQPTGTGTTGWRLIILPSTSIPISPTLSLRWTNTDAGTTSFRIDDITLTAVPEPAAAVLGALGLCALLRRRR